MGLSKESTSSEYTRSVDGRFISNMRLELLMREFPNKSRVELFDEYANRPIAFTMV